MKDITSPDGTVTASSNVQYTVSENGTYKFKLTDNAGNSGDYNVTVSNIDKVNPTLNISAPTAWGTDKVDISYSASDNERCCR